jgi:hypothetical protein
MENYIPTEEERLLSLVGFVPAEDILHAMGITTFLMEGVSGVVAQPIGDKFLDMTNVRPATKEETELHEMAVRDHHELEAACGLI